jgi:hypothetical protein
VGTIRCEGCGTEVVATTAGRHKKRFCSPRCGQRAWARANAEWLRVYQREHYQRTRQAKMPTEHPSVT